MEPLIVDNKSCKIYFIVQNTKVYFNADFDSGNAQKVQQIAPYTFKIHPGFDKTKNSTKNVFFHFKVYELKMCKATFIITRAYMIERLINRNQKNSQYFDYSPVFKRPNKDFEKVTLQVKKYYNFLDQPQISFSFQFQNDPFIQFAFAYPYSYQDCQNLVNNLSSKYKDHHSIYFHDEIFCHSPEGRINHLITITDKQNCQIQREEKIQNLFRSGKQRSFKINKPVIFMTARIHPGQSPSSFCIEGALRFLLNQRDCRSYLLRKTFHFIIIPMINPDGVYNGMFRTDMNGQNLNRVYLQCTQQKHSIIFNIKKYSLWLSKNKNVLFYFDFHAHPSSKNFFIYGNSYNEITLQAEIQLFGKMIEKNCPYFQNFESIYSEKQMKSKHRLDNYSKQGCARVFMHRTFNIIHSYTVQCGYFGAKRINQIQQQATFQSTGNYIEDKQFQKCLQRQYNPQSYMLMGKGILITILDLFGLNPYPKKIKGYSYTLVQLRKNCGSKVYLQTDLYKMTDANSYKKLNELSVLIEQIYYNQKLKGSNLKLASNENNYTLKEQLKYLNASPRQKIVLNMLRLKKSSSIKKITKNNSHQLSDSLLKLKQKKCFTSLTPPLISKKQKQQNNFLHQQVKKQNAKNNNQSTNQFFYQKYQIQSPSVNLFNQTKYLSDDQMIFTKSSILNSNSYQKIPIVASKQPLLLQTETYRQHGTTSLNLKQSLSDVRQKKIKSLLEESITLRKGSLSKIIFIRKDELKFLRISNLIQKKRQHDALNKPSIKQRNKLKNDLPHIKSKKLS